MPGDAVRNRIGFFVVLGFVQALWPLTMDLYLPAFPQIHRDLAAAPGQVQLTLTGAFAGMALGQLAAGPFSDRVGRMMPLTISLVIYGLATIGCAVAPTVEVLVLARVLQGLAAAASAVIVLAIVRDSASGARMVRLLARLQLVNGAFVVFAPAMGAALLAVVDWRGIFWLLVGYGLVLLAAVAMVVSPQETLPREKRSPARLRDLGRDYAALLGDRVFLSAVMANGLLWAGMMGYMASSAFLFQDTYGLSAAAYALIFGGHGAVMIVAAQVGARISTRYGLPRAVAIGSAGAGLSAVALLVSVAAVGAPALLPLLLPLFAFTASFGVLSPALQSVAMHHHGSRAGTAASLLGAATMVAGAIASPLVASFGLASGVPIAATLAVCAVGSFVVVRLGVRPRRSAGDTIVPEGDRR